MWWNNLLKKKQESPSKELSRKIRINLIGNKFDINVYLCMHHNFSPSPYKFKTTL
jgi:hypothetical protein